MASVAILPVVGALNTSAVPDRATSMSQSFLRRRHLSELGEGGAGRRELNLRHVGLQRHSVLLGEHSNFGFGQDVRTDQSFLDLRIDPELLKLGLRARSRARILRARRAPLADVVSEKPIGTTLPYSSLLKTLIDEEHIDAARRLLSVALSEIPHDVHLLALASLLGRPAITKTQASDVNRSREFRWLRTQASAYRGKWVAVDGDTLVAEADSLRELLETLRTSKRSRPPLVHRVQ